MAIIKNGQTRGRIGKFVYRIIDGKEVVHAYNPTIKQTENTKKASAKFANSSKMGSRVYKQVKIFASDFTTAKNYREIVSLLRGSIFLHDKQSKNEELNKDKQDSPELKEETIETSADADTTSEWNSIQDTDFLPINKDAILGDFLEGIPVANFSEDESTVQIPAFDFSKKGIKTPKEANYFEIFVSVYHSHSIMSYSLCDFNSGRVPIVSGLSEQDLTLPSDWMNPNEKEGIVYICFGLSFYASEDSRLPLTSSKLNPSAILGMWYKGK